MPGLRERLETVIFGSDTPAGRAFDLLLLVAILASVLLAMLESVSSLRLRYGELLRALEWGFTLLFTLEYLLRIYSAPSRRRYVFSFYGFVDLLAVLPSYLALVLSGAQYFLVVRAFRLLRIFRILKLVHFLGEADVLMDALRASRAKITVFLIAVLSLVVTIGAAMYLVEGPQNGFANIPISVYWAIVTLTTVGYGDISPKTPLGQFLASAVMILGYGVIAVPTGIVTSELTRSTRFGKQVCSECHRMGHDPDASYCKFCGGALEAG